MKPLKPFIEDDEAIVFVAQDAMDRDVLIADLTRRRAWMFWCGIVATLVLVAAVSAGVAQGRTFLTGPLLGFIYFWMKFSECTTTLRMLRLFSSLIERNAPDR